MPCRAVGAVIHAVMFGAVQGVIHAGQRCETEKQAADAAWALYLRLDGLPADTTAPPLLPAKPANTSRCFFHLSYATSRLINACSEPNMCHGHGLMLEAGWPCECDVLGSAQSALVMINMCQLAHMGMPAAAEMGMAAVQVFAHL